MSVINSCALGRRRVGFSEFKAGQGSVSGTGSSARAYLFLIGQTRLKDARLHGQSQVTILTTPSILDHEDNSRY